ncbi:hypothetical protein SAMN04488522_106119 [Pedobacter caeni]|uniref:Carboxypeptidase regulatory-like domain-containing protein n=1 Tax=Pedobacter caeni TaxID=288992 RepID=A0A1M5KWS5_9SPHI|nr:hypothetical protein SAMN04488522_106119 [Pedobacter caeni]
MFTTISTLTLAQTDTKTQLIGTVIDSVTYTGTDFATISLFKQGANEPFTQISRDSKGEFKFQSIPQGKYRLIVDVSILKEVTIQAKVPVLGE